MAGVKFECGSRISVLAPAYNEESTIAESVRSLLALNYPNLELILVNDGSTDGTLSVLQEQFDLVEIHPIYQRNIETKLVRSLCFAPISKPDHR